MTDCLYVHDCECVIVMCPHELVCFCTLQILLSLNCTPESNLECELRKMQIAELGNQKHY